MRSKVIIGLGGLVVLLALVGSGAFWFWRCCEAPSSLADRPPATAQAPSPEAAASSQPHAVTPASPETATPSSPQTTTPSSPQTAAATPQGASLPASEGEATGTAAPADVAAATPSFDVVRTEPGGEGVIAGRAAPGWTVKVVSGGAEVAEATADSQGEWTVVLDKPLPAGQHKLSLQATPPQGGRVVASRQSVPVAVTAAPRPSLQVAKPRGATPGGAQQTASIEQSGDAGASLLPEQRKPGTYTIQRGDTLWAIAERYLGAGMRYVAIFKTNRGAIKNPNLIHPEQQVNVPEE
ncbi:MAG: LysM peptidoglycan-binding domain-containing protein [Methyloceanibacter sp.]